MENFYSTRKTEFQEFIQQQFQSMKDLQSGFAAIRSRLTEERAEIDRLTALRETLEAAAAESVELSRESFDTAKSNVQKNAAEIKSLRDSIAALEKLLPTKQIELDRSRERLARRIAEFSSLHKSPVELAITDLLTEALRLRDEFITGLEAMAIDCGIHFTGIDDLAIPGLRHPRLRLTIAGRGMIERQAALNALRGLPTDPAAQTPQAVQDAATGQQDTAQTAAIDNADAGETESEVEIHDGGGDDLDEVTQQVKKEFGIK